MRKFVASAAMLVALTALVCLPALVHDSVRDAPDAYEPTRITRYDARFVVDDRGRMDAVETLDVSVGSDRHGIFRFFDTFDPNAPREHRRAHDLTVTRNGRVEPWADESSGWGRYQVAKVGDADRTLDAGVHTYELSYRVDDVLLAGVDGEARFYWNLVPPGWQQQIGTTHLSVDLPAAVVGEPRCMVGQGRADGCTAQLEDDGRRIVVSTGGLDRRTPVTIDAQLAMTAPDPEHQMPWHTRWHRVLGSWLPGPPLVLLLTAGAAWLGWRRSRRSFETAPGFPLTYAPPEGIGPAQAGFVLRERSTRDHYVGNLMHAAQQGLTTLEVTDRGWTVTGLDGVTATDPVTAAQAHSLGVTPGQAFTALPDSVTAGRTLSSSVSATGTAVKEWALREGVMSASPRTAWLTVIGAAVLAAFLFGFAPATMVALVPGGYAVFGFWALMPGSSTRRTARGRELWSRVGGFERVLSTPSSRDRFDFSGREELYTAYIPWAVAFGCAEAWAAKYTAETGSPPPEPHYLAGAGAGAGAGQVGRAVQESFSRTLDSAISSYAATQSSSSSGGGSSGGGGGGGGGGGSW